MPRPRLSREEATRRRREAALKGAATVRARRGDSRPPIGDSIVPKGGELIARAQSMGREADLFYEAHLKRYGQQALAMDRGATAAGSTGSWTVSSGPTARRSPYRTGGGSHR